MGSIDLTPDPVVKLMLSLFDWADWDDTDRGQLEERQAKVAPILRGNHPLEDFTPPRKEPSTRSRVIDDKTLIGW